MIVTDDRCGGEMHSVVLYSDVCWKGAWAEVYLDLEVHLAQ
jgi:hypothetical protein